jgi:hypothetical protein
MSAPPLRRVSVVDRRVPLPKGTRVVRNLVDSCRCCDNRSADRRPRQFGTVMPYDEQFSHGGFPVRWDNGIWEAQLDVSYVTAVSPEQEAALGGRPLPPTELRRAAS